MSTISFVLRLANRQGEHPVSVKHTHLNLTPFVKATGVSVPARYFDKDTGKVSNKVPQHVAFNARIEQVRSDVEKAADYLLNKTKQAPDRAAMDVEYADILRRRQKLGKDLVVARKFYLSQADRLRDELLDLENQVVAKRAEIQELEMALGNFENRLLTTFITAFIQSDAVRLATNRVYAALRANVTEFRPHLRIEEVTPAVLKDFEKFLVNKKVYTKQHPGGKRLSNETVKLYLIRMKTIVRRFADVAGIDATALNTLNNHRMTNDTLKSKGIIYLTPSELQDLADVQLPNPSQERVRDSFLLMAATGLRFSDSFITPEQVKAGYIVLHTKKTSTLVKIPLNANATAILEKYSYNMPRYSFQWFQRTIKEVGKLARLTSLELVAVKNGTDTTSDYVEKWKVLSAHVARKTFITYALAGNVNPAVLKGWIGHSKMEMMLNHYASGTINTVQEMNKMPLTV